MIPALAIGNSFSWLLSFDILPSSCLLLKYFLPFRHCKVLQASHLILFPAPVLKSAIPPRSPESFYWSGIRNQELGTRYAHCYRGIIISRLFQQIGIIIYFKDEKDTIEMMNQEIKSLHDAGIITNEQFVQARLILNQRKMGKI